MRPQRGPSYRCDRNDIPDDEDWYAQPRALWERALDDEGRDHLVKNIVGSMNDTAMAHPDPRPIQERMLTHWFKVHPDLGRRIADGLNLTQQRQAAE